MIRSITTCVLLLGISFHLSAQKFIEKTYGHPEDDYPFSMIQTSDGGYAMIGGGYLDHIFNGYFVKTNTDGDTLWTKTYGSGYNVFSSIVETDDHGYLILGQSSNTPKLTRTDANGDTLWTKTYDGLSGLKIIATSDNKYVLLCNTALDNNTVLYKINASGDIIWSKTYMTAGSKGSGDLKETSDKGFIIGTDFQKDAYLIKTNSTGDSLWAKQFTKEGTEFITSVLITYDNHYLLAGNNWGTEMTSNSNIYVIETNTDGDTVLTKSYGVTGLDLYLQDIKQANDGSFLILGDNDMDMLLVKTNTVGDTLFTRTYGGDKYDSGVTLLLSADNKTLSLLGVTESFGAGVSDFYFIKTDANGIILGTDDQKLATSDEIQVTPNPFVDQITIKLPAEAHVSIYDSKGIFMDSYTMDQQKTIPLEGAKGFYFVRVTSGEQTYVYKVVKM